MIINCESETELLHTLGGIIEEIWTPSWSKIFLKKKKKKKSDTLLLN